jgi:polyferredoxin
LFCPVSALINVFNKISFLQLKKTIKFCSYCGNCWRVCPMNIKEVYKNDGNIIKDDCNLCLKCLENCPREKALSINYFNKTIFSSKFKKP